MDSANTQTNGLKALHLKEVLETLLVWWHSYTDCSFRVPSYLQFTAVYAAHNNLSPLYENDHDEHNYQLVLCLNLWEYLSCKNQYINIIRYQTRGYALDRNFAAGPHLRPYHGGLENLNDQALRRPPTQRSLVVRCVERWQWEGSQPWWKCWWWCLSGEWMLMSGLLESSASCAEDAAVLWTLQALCAYDHARHHALTLNSVETKKY